MKDGKTRADIKPGMEVDVILKKDQRTGERTRGGSGKVTWKRQHTPGLSKP